jgi:hypothetical protein
MDDRDVATQFENFDQRLVRVEQILPILATKEDLDDLRREIQFAVEPLATKDELQRAIEPLATKDELQRAIEPLATKDELQRAIEPLATKDELQRAIEPLATKEDCRAEGARSRRHMDVLTEALRNDVQLVAEHVAYLATKISSR